MAQHVFLSQTGFRSKQMSVGENNIKNYEIPYRVIGIFH
jgi:hypothetical protein